ncbi:MAG TPA: hypothetical protein VM054_05450 [bacterium]|nr:hypothetical protein [bacterium]
MKNRPASFYLFLLTVLLLAGPQLVGGASDEAPIVGCTFPNFGCDDPTGPSETETSTCTLVSALVNEQDLDPSDPVLTVAPGENIVGLVTLETYNAGSSSSTAPLAATPSFGDHKSSYWEITINIPSGKATFDVTLNLNAPEDEGTYFLFFAWYAEKTSGNVMSLTDWQYPGGDEWDDDVDIADWDDYQAQQGIDNGWVETDYLDEYGEYVENVVFPGTAIRVLVQAR